MEHRVYAGAKTGETTTTAEFDLKGPVPPLRKVNFNGTEYVAVSDLRGWWEYIADNIVSDDASPEQQADEQVVANVIRILTRFTSDRLAV